MKENDIEPGMLVRTNYAVRRGSRDGVLVGDKSWNTRKADAVGVVMHHVPGHDTWAWFVQHVKTIGENEVAVYLSYEFDPIDIGDLWLSYQEEAKRIQGTIDKFKIVAVRQ